MSSRVGSVAVFFLWDTLGSVIRFPLWWYGAGWRGVMNWCGRSLRYQWKATNIVLWLKNFFVPMYGMYDWTSRLISIAMRFFVILGRLIAFLLSSLVYGLVILTWVLAPLAFLFLLLENAGRGALSSIIGY